MDARLHHHRAKPLEKLNRRQHQGGGSSRQRLPQPVLKLALRTNANAGHGIGSSLDEVIAERSDVYAFFFHELGATYKPVAAP